MHRAEFARNRTFPNDGFQGPLSRQLIEHTFHERMTDAQPARKLSAAFCSLRRYDAQQYFEHVMLQFPATWNPDTQSRRRSVRSATTRARQRGSSASFVFPDA